MSDFDFGGWLGGGSVVAASIPLRAQIQAARIADKPTTVQFKRNGVFLPEQTIRIEWTETVTEMESELGITALRRGHIIHYKDHPTLPDLDIDKWDTFVLDDKEYTVTSVNRELTGQLQATVEVV